MSSPRHRTRLTRALLALTLAVVPALAVAPVAVAAPASVPAVTSPIVLAAAAPPGLTIVGDATYDVVPDEARVKVTVVLTVKNNLKDTKTKRYFFRTGFVTVLPNTANFKLTAASGKPKVSVSSRTGTYVNLKLDFGSNLAAGKTTTLTLTYDIKDPGGAPDRAVRISQSLVSFAAWAVAAPGSTGGSVTVRFPAGYDVEVRRGPLTGPTKDGVERDVWTSGTLTAPLDFVADFSADRPTDYVETQRTVTLASGTATVTLQAWPDDPAWEERVGSLIERAVPVLERQIGLPWPSDQPLQVHETLVRSTGGYAGIYSPGDHRVDIAYAAPDSVVIHELAHAWFNGGLVADRWIAEGFASHYADLAAKELKIPVTPITPPGDATPPTPLNAWGEAAPETPDAESWGYAASLQLADAIAARAGEQALHEVWQDAANGIGAYQPSAAGVDPEPGAGDAGAAAGVPDWRGFLDLLEDATGKDFGDLWRQWVARPDDLPVLDARAAAREAYATTVDAAGEWQLPATIRAAMRAWRFDVAQEQLSLADGVLAQRAQLESTAAAAGATLPPTLRGTFEGDAGLAAAAAEATAEQAVIDAIGAARTAKPAGQGVLDEAVTSIGLLFESPETDLDNAVAGLAAGDLQSAFADATLAESVWRNAADSGRNRILSVVLLVIATILLIGLVQRGLIPPPPGVHPKARERGGTLAGHPARTADGAGAAGEEGGAATQA